MDHHPRSIRGNSTSRPSTSCRSRLVYSLVGIGMPRVDPQQLSTMLPAVTVLDTRGVVMQETRRHDMHPATAKQSPTSARDPPLTDSLSSVPFRSVASAIRDFDNLISSPNCSLLVRQQTQAVVEASGERPVQRDAESKALASRRK